MDNSGNGAMTGISTITATTGKGLLPEVNFHQPLRVAQAEAVLDGNGSISSINILDGGFGYVEEPEAYIMGGNSDAEVTIKIDQNNSSASYGQVIDINVTNGGTQGMKKMEPSFLYSKDSQELNQEERVLLLKLSWSWLKSREVKSGNGNRHLMWWTVALVIRNPQLW